MYTPLWLVLRGSNVTVVVDCDTVGSLLVTVTLLDSTTFIHVTTGGVTREIGEVAVQFRVKGKLATEVPVSVIDTTGGGGTVKERAKVVN